jgi:LPXTG-motif cell wall-anchored protein
MFLTDQTQYGGSRTPAITSPGGASLASNLGSAAMGMMTGGMSTALDAAMKAAGDSSTTVQTPTVTSTQSTGSKVFNLQPAATAMEYNNFWASVTGVKSGNSFLPILAVILLAVLAFVIIRRK